MLKHLLSIVIYFSQNGCTIETAHVSCSMERDFKDNKKLHTTTHQHDILSEILLF